MDAVLTHRRNAEPRHPVEITAVRSVFISDTHFGCAYAKADRLLKFLNCLQPEFIYLVGDFIDGWELKRRWRWSDELTAVLRFLMELAREGCTVRYAIGNHDDFLRENSLLTEFVAAGGIEIAEEFVHLTDDGRRFLVLHGDRFDHFSQCSAPVEWVASAAYNAMLAGNDLWHRWFGGHHGVVSGRVKSSLRAMSRHVAKFRTDSIEYTKASGCDGIICGHIHSPEHSWIQGIEYCNTGDWLENCSALIELRDGSLSLHLEEFATARNDSARI
ncbi:MAG: UDP-2,3-diacylglucosamine diphosphatase [Planctomycetaceae bacterium]